MSAQYYLIDNKKVMEYFKKLFVKRFPYDDEITVNNVTYAVDKKLKKPYSAWPNDRDAFVLTTQGLVHWERPSFDVFEDGDVVLTGVHDLNKRLITGYESCNGYICLGFLPSPSTPRLSGDYLKNYLVAYDDDEKKLFSMDEVGIDVKESGDELIIDALSVENYYEIGVKMQDKVYIIDFVDYEIRTKK